MLRDRRKRLDQRMAHEPRVYWCTLQRYADLAFRLSIYNLARPRRNPVLRSKANTRHFCYYDKIHACPPAEAEMQQYFRVSPPSVHQMVLALEANGLIERTSGQARSIRLLISREELPDLV